MYDLATILEQKQNEATTMDAISFIPGQLGVVQALNNLSKEKPDWDIEILEGDDDNPSTVTFGDRLKVSVPKKHWGAFSTLFREGMDSKTKNIRFYPVEESFGVLLRKATRFHPVLSKMKVFEKTVKTWIRAFPNSKFVTKSNSSVPSICWNGRRSVVQQFMAFAQKECKDRGSREILLQALSEKSSLSPTLFFRKHESIVGCRIASVYEGTSLVFEATVGFDGNCSYTLVVDDKEVCDVIEESVRGPIRIGNVFTLHRNPLLQIQAVKNAVDESVDIEEAAKAKALAEAKAALEEKKKKESKKNDSSKSNRS